MGVSSRDARCVLDWLVLTASGAAQKRGYEAQLKARERAGTFEGVCRRWMVVADPKGKRAGSGGATLVVLHELAKRLGRGRGRGGAKQEGSVARLFAGQRVLLIHSGGDSRRLPAYAAQGKIFVPLPGVAKGRIPLTLFDRILEDLAAVPLPESGRVLIASGDVLLGVGRHGPRMDQADLVVAAYRGPMATARRHGVYVADGRGRLVDVMQKPTAAEARRRGAVDARGRLLVDIGLVSLSPRAVGRWLAAAGERTGRGDEPRGLMAELLAGRAEAVDLYADLMGAMGRKGRGPAGASQGVKGVIRDEGAAITVVPGCEFIHIGSTREFIEGLTSDEWLTARAIRPLKGSVLAFNSVLTSKARLTGPTVVENSWIGPRSRLRGWNLVVGVNLGRRLDAMLMGGLKGFPGEVERALRERAVEVRRGIGLARWPLRGKSDLVFAFGVDDDFKTTMEHGGTICGFPLSKVCRGASLDPSGLWPGDTNPRERTAWNARLWKRGDSVASLAHALALGAGRFDVLRDMRSLVSIGESVGRVNHDGLTSWRNTEARNERVQMSAHSLVSDPEADAVSIVKEMNQGLFGLFFPAEKVGARLAPAIRAAKEPLERARLYRAGALLAESSPGARFGLPRAARSDPETLNGLALAEVATAVTRRMSRADAAESAILPGVCVCVTAPVRIDFAGGWSDTPPICDERGGTVVNGAITLGGRHPVRVTARVLDEPRIRVTSVDLGLSVTLTETRRVLDHADPHDWAALPKAALVLGGIVPRRAGEDLRRRLERFGGGLELTMEAAVPKGSGLGTSSILGAAVLACLDRVCGRRGGVRSLVQRTSILEQMMSTAGGWQDQAGGITAGVKILRTKVGMDQVPRIEGLPLPGIESLARAGRLLLYYTGYKRLAKDILQNVVLRYLAREREALRIIERLKAGAERMAADLREGNGEGFARGVLEYWELKKAIDPGATNAKIEGIIDSVRKELVGYELPGAGGGGFVFMIAADARAARRVRERLSRRPPNAQARFCEFAIDDEGLRGRVM